MWSVGISVSPCEEAARLGYDERQINRIVIRMAQYFLDQNKRVIFGHDWREDGVMRAVADFAGVVAARSVTVEETKDRVRLEGDVEPAQARMLNVVPAGRESLSAAAVEAERDSGGVLVVIPARDGLGLLMEEDVQTVVTIAGLDGRSGREAELTALRHVITALLNPGCRVCLGGKTSGYQGKEPGIMEEARLALAYRKPLYLMGGFGGATRIFGADPGQGGMVYWDTENGLMAEEKHELFETTDVERAIRLISGGIRVWRAAS